MYYDPILCMNVPDSVKTADKRTVDAGEVSYREIQSAVRQAKVGDVEVIADDSSDSIKGFKVNWPGIGSVSPSEAIKFANNIIKAANNAMQLDSKYKGMKETY